MSAALTQDNGTADGPKPKNQPEQSPGRGAANTKLWLGKDYSNFITRDWVQLDRPFEGTSFELLSLKHKDI